MLTKKELVEKSIDFASCLENMNIEKKYMKQYFKLNSDKIRGTNQELLDSLQAQIEKNPDIESKIQNEYEKSLRAINSYYYHSSISLVHTFFESHLTLLCHIIAEQTGSEFKIQVLKGNNNIELALDYLMIATGLEKSLIEKHKPRLGKFQNLRNKIIHENSCFKDEKDMQKLQNGFYSNIDFDENNMRFFINTDDLAVEYLNKSSLFITKIIEFLNTKDFLVSPKVGIEDEIDVFG